MLEPPTDSTRSDTYQPCRLWGEEVHFLGAKQFNLLRPFNHKSAPERGSPNDRGNLSRGRTSSRNSHAPIPATKQSVSHAHLCALFRRLKCFWVVQILPKRQNCLPQRCPDSVMHICFIVVQDSPKHQNYQRWIWLIFVMDTCFQIAKV